MEFFEIKFDDTFEAAVWFKGTNTDNPKDQEKCTKGRSLGKATMQRNINLR